MIVVMLFTPHVWGQKFTWNNSMEHLLDLFKFFPEAFEGQGSQFSPFFHHFHHLIDGIWLHESLVQACQYRVFDHTLSFHQIAAFILASRRLKGLNGSFWSQGRLLMVPDSVQPRRTLPRQISASVTFATFLRPKWRLQSGGNLRYDQDTKLTCLHQTFMQSVSNGTLPLWSNRILISFLCLSCTANKLNCYNIKRIQERVKSCMVIMYNDHIF